MIAKMILFSHNKDDINNFLSKFYNNNINIQKNTWEKSYNNPIEIADLVGVYTDNYDDFELNFWICLDEGLIFQVNNKNGNEIIKYLFERFPY